MTCKNKGNMEILAPAGSMESIYAAVRCGADAVYIGGKRFSARANAVNFDDDEIRQAVEYCHLHGVKVYRAMNVIIFDSEMKAFCQDVRISAEAGIDGLIIQDIGGAEAAKRVVCDMPLHGSTQMTIHTPEGALFARDMGFCRIVPARELDADAIAQICRTGVETEVFAHGALCMCVSGQCYMSAMIGSRSANRGQCAQSCRLPFSAEGKNSGRNDLSLKDMSYLYHMDRLCHAGAASLKIEGRMKRAEYTAAAVTALRKACSGCDRDTLDSEYERLKAVFSRSGFTDGYLTGRLGADMFGMRSKDDVTAAGEVLPQLAELFRKESKAAVIDFHFSAHMGAPISLTFSCGEISGTVCGDVPSAAVNRPATFDDVKKQLSKLGGTIYELGELTVDIDERIAVPASALNALRRDAAALADRLRTQHFTPKYTVNSEEYVPVRFDAVRSDRYSIRVMTDNAETAERLDDNSIELVILPMDECFRLSEKADRSRISVYMPRFIVDEEKTLSSLEQLRDMGFSHVTCTNYAYIPAAVRLGMTAHGGAGLNISNSEALFALNRRGLADAVLSPEMKAGEISSVRSPMPVGIYAYGNQPLMLTRNCPVKNTSGCASCGGKGKLTDRTGREFAVKCSRQHGYVEILNSDTLTLSDCMNDLRGLGFIVIDGGSLSADRIMEIISDYRKGEKPSGKFTRGLYYRGVI